METHGHPHHEEGAHGHETRDAHFRSVVISGIGLLGLMVAGLVVAFILLNLYTGSTAEPGAKPETLLGPPARPLPPGPNLQPDPHADLVALRAHEDSVLTSYGFTGKDSSIARIPIDRAMQLIVKQGLPVHSERP